MELSGVLNTSRSTTDDNHVHQSVNLLLGLVLEGGSLDTVEELGSDLVGIAELLEETSMFWDTLDTECLVLATNGVDKVVVWDRDRTSGTSNIGEIWRVSSAARDEAGTDPGR